MKKAIILSAVLVVTSTAAYAGVSSIKEYGNKSDTGETMYEVTCTSGKTGLIYWHNDQWYHSFLGNMGGQNRNLNEQAELFCD